MKLLLILIVYCNICIKSLKLKYNNNNNRYKSILFHNNNNNDNNDNNDDSSSTPYVDALLSSVDLIKHRYFFPGHNGGKGSPNSIINILKNALYYDLPELDELDNIHSPEGPLLKSLELTKILYNSYKSWYLVNGSTSGILSAILTCFRIYQRINSSNIDNNNNNNNKIVFLLGRDSHKSAFDALSLAGVDGILLPCNYDEKFQIPLGISIKSIKEAIKLYKGKICGLLITRPSYQGVTCNTNTLKDIINLCKLNSIPVIIDEAHGSHLKFLNDNDMKDAISCGADISIQSSHKTLTSLSQTGMMHINKDAFSYLDDKFNDNIKGYEYGSEILHECFSMLTTTSPNSLFLASLDATRGQFAKDGYKYLEIAINAINDIKNNIKNNNNGKIHLLDDSKNVKELNLHIDPLKLTIQVNNNENIKIDDKMCEEEGIYCELIDKKYISYALSPLSTNETLKVLKDNLIYYNNNNNHDDIVTIKYDNDNNDNVSDKKKKYQKPFYELSYLNIVKISKNLSKSIYIEDCIGKISMETICIYPPGIPLLIKGEMITIDHINTLLALKSAYQDNNNNDNIYIDNDYIDKGSSITGWSDNNLEKIKVIF